MIKRNGHLFLFVKVLLVLLDPLDLLDLLALRGLPEQDTTEQTSRLLIQWVRDLILEKQKISHSVTLKNEENLKLFQSTFFWSMCDHCE